MTYELPDDFENPSEAGVLKGRCYWCGEAGDSREDIIPRWVDRNYNPPTEMCRGPKVELRKNYGHGTKSAVQSRIATKAVATRGTCESCNNGWMSRLEHSVIGLVAPMMNGEAVTLRQTEQLVIARWADMKMLCLDADPRNSDPGLSSAAARGAVYEEERPADEFAVSVAAYRVPGRFFVTMPHQRGTGSEHQPLTQWSFVMGLGHFIVRVQGRTGSVLPPTLEQAPGGLHDGEAFTCWPPQLGDAEWPPPKQLDTESLLAFVEEGLPESERSESHRAWAADFADRPEQLCGICDEVHGDLVLDLPLSTPDSAQGRPQHSTVAERTGTHPG